MVGEGFKTYIVVLLFCYVIAVVSTLLRLWHRITRNQVSWDDFWACIAMFSALLLASLLILRAVVDMETEAIPVQSFAKWVASLASVTAVWSARLSMGATVVRILPPGRQKLITEVSNVLMALLWLVIVIQKIFVCGIPVPAFPNCAVSRSFLALSIVANVIASVWLVFWPIYVILRTRRRLSNMATTCLSDTYHRLLMACFGTSIFLLAGNLAHAAYYFTGDAFRLTVTGHVEVLLSVFLCNVLVLVTSAYRILSGSGRSSLIVATSPIRPGSPPSPSQARLIGERPYHMDCTRYPRRYNTGPHCHSTFLRPATPSIPADGRQSRLDYWESRPASPQMAAISPTQYRTGRI